jgi:universal stress protein E
VVVDPTAAAHPSVEKAARIALHAGARLELYVCDAEQGGADSGPGRGARHERHLSMLELLARPLRAQGLEVETHCEWTSPFEAGVGRHVLRTRPDLVVKDTHAHVVARSPVTLTDWILMRQVAAPLLLVRSQRWPEKLRLSVSADPCHPAVRTPTLDQAMLEVGCLLGDALIAELDVLHVLEQPPHLPGEPVEPAMKQAYQATARALVESMIAIANTRGVRIPARYREGNAAECIIEFARTHRPDVLIMGAAPRPRWAYAAANGTAAQILEAIPCDMLVIKPPGFVSPLLTTDD